MKSVNYEFISLTCSKTHDTSNGYEIAEFANKNNYELAKEQIKIKYNPKNYDQ